MHMSFLVLRSRRCLAEISRVIDRYRICRFFPSYTRAGRQCPVDRLIISHRQDFFPCISHPIASSIRQRLRFSRSSPTSLRRLMLEIRRCSACLIFCQRLIPSTTTFWSSAWRGRLVFVTRCYIDWLRFYLLVRRQSVFLRRSFIIGSSSCLRGPAGFGVGAAVIPALYGRRW